LEDLKVFEFVILGGGLAGLTFALEASRRGEQVVVLESEGQIGGLSRTLTFGDYRFDIGGHRFHSNWPHVYDWVVTLMGGDLLEVDRYSRILLNGRYADYPLRFLNALGVLSLPQAVRVCV
jgi:protoporphyrinogen oxidase